jgi:putative tricarboxylic transport membrane protein
MLALRRAVPYAAVMIVGAYLYWLALNLEFPSVPGRLGPDAWPKMVLGLLLLTCLVGLVNSFRRADAPMDGGGAGEGRPVLLPGDIADEEDAGPSRYGLVGMGFALFLVYPVALEYLGFPIATFLMMALFMLVGQWRNLPGILLTSLLATLVLFYIFRGIVYVSLPLGTGRFQEFTLWLAQLLQMR